jgi:cyclopropane-fatty-acyl-phospholipid synthase
VTTTTISDAQFEMARARVVREGLQDRVEILKEDYRNLEGEYDKLVSIEMLEAVGHDNLDTYFRQCARRLKDDGVMLVQVISMPEQRYDQYLKNSDFIQKYIFPGSCCPALGAMLTAVKRTTDMKIVHLEDIAGHYARTLRDWRANFDRNEQKVRALGYSERFLRMWRYYLCYCETGFAERYLSDYQIVLARPGNRGDRADGSI